MSRADAHSLDGRVAVVTGGGKGIGAAIAHRLAEAGADVALTARTAADLDAVADTVRSVGRRALVVPGDVNDLDLLAELVDRTVAELGGLDILVNNAGGSTSRPFLQTTVADLEASFHFNISSPFELTRLAVPHLLDRGGGAVVNIGSVAGSKAVRGTLTHSLTKSALAQLTRLGATELAPRVRVNAVLPGAIETDSLATFLSTMDPSVRDEMLRRTPMRRNGLPDDIAHAVVFLASPAASWITGQLLTVDGDAEAVLIPKDQPDL